ncbi:MAG TPA: hypothetical protein VN775_03375 [Opitutaceae bacterium]|nr:hypothetical protein [Opitutaceae bacterium]
MNRALKILLAIMAAAAPAAAQDSAPPTPTPADPGQATTPASGAAAGDASSVVLAQKPPALAPMRAGNGDDGGRAVSSKIAADLASEMPKYAPPTPTPAVTAEPQDMRDIDKPRNEIKRLPQYVVRESRPLVFRNRDLFTTEGLVNLSFKSHPGLLFGNFLGLNSGIAYQMYLDEQRQTNMDDLTDTARAMARGGDSAESAYILKESQETYMRPIEETWTGPGGNGGFSGGGGR